MVADGTISIPCGEAADMMWGVRIAHLIYTGVPKGTLGQNYLKRPPQFKPILRMKWHTVIWISIVCLWLAGTIAKEDQM